MLLIASLLLVAMILPAPARASTLRPGTFVMVTWQSGESPCCQVINLDPVSLTESVVTSGGYIVDPQDIAVSQQGDIYITVPTIGVVRVHPDAGSQSVFASMGSLGGGAPVGVAIGESGIYVSLQGSPARVVQLDASGSITRVVASGGLLTLPAGMAIGHDGALYVCETIAPGSGTGGGIVRVDLASGTQTLVASGDPLHGPFDVSAAPDGSLWSVQRGFRLHERRGALVRTTTDGQSATMPSAFDYVSGVAIRSDGFTLVGDCAPVHGDCFYAFARIYPDGPYVSSSSSGPMAVVPDMTTSMTRSTWGRLKLIYR